jgi:rhodanese-related sulfurtransferase
VGEPGVLPRSIGQANAVSAIPEIGRDELSRSIERGDDIVIVDALAPMSFAHSHLPGAINLPPEWVDERAPRRIPELDAEVVVYCASATCDSSIEVGSRLVELGYRNVRHYVGGKKDWVDAGLPLEGGGRRAVKSTSR